MSNYFENLSIEEKRDELNRETLRLVLMINKIIDDSKTDYFNYVPNTGVDEDYYLNEEYKLIKEATEKLVNIFK